MNPSVNVSVSHGVVLAPRRPQVSMASLACMPSGPCWIAANPLASCGCRKVKRADACTTWSSWRVSVGHVSKRCPETSWTASPRGLPIRESSLSVRRWHRESEESLWHKLKAWPLETPPLLLILDGVTDVHNLGACLRSADAAGVHGVLVPKDKSAPLNATVRKVACGAAESVPVYQVTNLARAMARLKEEGVWITGTAGEAEGSVFEADLRGPTALVMGAEGKGMRRLTREACDTLVKLPMAGAVSSLNVSVATGICLFEAVRQRSSS